MENAVEIPNLKKFLYEIQDAKSLNDKDLFKDRKNVLDLKLIVMIDISGSIGRETFENFMKQIDKLRGLSKVKILEFDSRVVACYDYFNTHQNEVMRLSGGGGTNYVEVFEMATRMKPEGLIILTDGQDFGEEAKNPEIHTAVILTEDGKVRYDWMKEIGRIKGVKKITDETHNEIDTDMKADNEALSGFEDDLDSDEEDDD